MTKLVRLNEVQWSDNKYRTDMLIAQGFKVVKTAKKAETEPAAEIAAAPETEQAADTKKKTAKKGE